jgi:hypothetical protein
MLHRAKLLALLTPFYLINTILSYTWSMKVMIHDQPPYLNLRLCYGREKEKYYLFFSKSFLFFF